MNVWLTIIGGTYLIALVFFAIRARGQNTDVSNYLFAGSNIGAFIGCLTIGATLFSTFTLMGMPDFVRNHGVGAWFFLGVSDTAMAIVMLWFAFHLRNKASQLGFQGMSRLLRQRYGYEFVGWVYFVAILMFLVPYVAIQIRGVSIFLAALYPDFIPVWGWCLCVMLTLLAYSELGGLRAIIYSDALQGILLLSVTWIVAFLCLSRAGGIKEMFSRLSEETSSLLTIPGPEGLITPQFLIASFVIICLLPVTQPQLATRLVIIKDFSAVRLMVVAVAVFSILVILPTLGIGFYGALYYQEASPADFLAGVLVGEQTAYIGATVIVGLLAAAMSTADSQLFALGTELRSILPGTSEQSLTVTRLVIFAFGLTTLVFALVSSDQLVQLARVSFAGTALLAPMILAAVLLTQRLSFWIPGATVIALLIFLASLAGIVPDTFSGLRIDLLLLCVLAVTTVTSLVISRQSLLPVPD